MKQMECVFCQKTYSLDLFNLFCPECREPLLVKSPGQLLPVHSEKKSSLERHLGFLPSDEIIPGISLGEGSTPLLKLNRLMDQFNLPEIYIKNEMLNPTGSFKDRGTVIAVHKAVSMGIKTIGTVSTGNMAVSTAAYGARAGIKTLVLVSEETSDEKLYSAAVHGAILIKVKGDYGELFYKSLETGRKNHIYFINSTDPFRIEGYKVTAFELFDQFKEKIPTHIFVPVSSGGHIIGLMKAFKELKKRHKIDKYPAFIGVQPEKASPIAEAFLKGESKYTRIKKAGSVAQSINNPAPPGGNLVLKMIKELNGQIIKVPDSEILRAQSLLALYEGLFCLPASAATLAGLFRLKREKKLDPQDQTVLILTGAGIKNIKILDSSKMVILQTSLKKLDHTISSLLR
jgi:threonine synthase